MTILYEDFVQFAGGFPALVIFFSFIMVVIMKDFQTFMFLLFICLAEFIVRILKRIFKTMMGTKEWPLLGKGTRPHQRKPRPCFWPGFKYICTDYGMPSGHALYAAVFSSYWIARLINAPYKILMILFFSSITLLVMYSRVMWAKVHTWQQVIVGAIFGSLIGWHYYGFVENIKSKYVGNL